MRYSKKHKSGHNPSELTNKHWKRLQKLLPMPVKQPGRSGRPAVDLRAVINAIFYITRSGCAWRMLPREYPHWKTVYGYYWRWSHQQVWQRIHVRLVKQVRLKAHRKKRPSAAIIDSASRKTTAPAARADRGGESRLRRRETGFWPQTIYSSRYLGTAIGHSGGNGQC